VGKAEVIEQATQGCQGSLQEVSSGHYPSLTESKDATNQQHPSQWTSVKITETHLAIHQGTTHRNYWSRTIKGERTSTF
jgi:hypothetical protein